MNPARWLSQTFTFFLGVGVLLLSAGCGNFFVTKHRVLVDAIAAPGVQKPTALSYRLLAKTSTVNHVPVQVPVVIACLNAALANQGMFEAPKGVPSDLFIEVGFGTDTTPRVDAAARETYLQLSARSNPDGSLDRATGPELWDVRVAILGLSGRMETAMPLLSTVAAGYIATDTHMETKVEIPQNSPVVASVRESAIEILEGKSATATATLPAPKAPAGAK